MTHAAPETVVDLAGARRARAREAFWDHLAPPPIQINGEDGVSESLDIAVETATRVRVDADITFAAREAVPELPLVTTKELRKLIEAAFRAAGFEVEQ